MTDRAKLNLLIPDDLDELPKPTAEALAKAVASETKTPNATTTVASAPSSIKWGDKNVATVGDGLDRIKTDPGKVIRFALVPTYDPTAAKSHFIGTGERKGLFRCPGANCPRCKAGEEARWTVAAMAVQYINADLETGKLPTDAVPVYKIGHLSLSQSNFKAIGELPEEGKSPYDVDFKMMFDGRRYTFSVIASTPRYKARNEEATILELAKPHAAKLANKVGRAITAAALKAIGSTGEPMSLSTALDGMDD
jgi:hypothetical protein